MTLLDYLPGRATTSQGVYTKAVQLTFEVPTHFNNKLIRICNLLYA